MYATLLLAAVLQLPVATLTPPVGQGFAVVELFTSEGCSSCPPADDVLGTLGGPQVFPLAFHVDYWDALGWPDPFASALATARQRQYAEGGRVYTPQMVVNGRRAFVGSDAEQARLAIAAAVAIPSALQITLSGDATRGQIRWRLAGTTEGLRLQIALVEGGLSIPVPRGENAGRTLRHEHVVRAFQSLPVQGLEGAAELAVPADARKENLKMIVYLQDQKTLAIVAAARL